MFQRNLRRRICTRLGTRVQGNCEENQESSFHNQMQSDKDIYFAILAFTFPLCGFHVAYMNTKPLFGLSTTFGTLYIFKGGKMLLITAGSAYFPTCEFDMHAIRVRRPSSVSALKHAFYILIEAHHSLMLTTKTIFVHVQIYCFGTFQRLWSCK